LLWLRVPSHVAAQEHGSLLGRIEPAGVHTEAPAGAAKAARRLQEGCKEVKPGRQSASAGLPEGGRGSCHQQQLQQGAEAGVLLGEETKEPHQGAAQAPHGGAVKGLQEGPKGGPKGAARMPRQEGGQGSATRTNRAKCRMVWDPGITHPWVWGWGWRWSLGP